MDASRFRAGLLLMLTFAAGAAVGVAGDRWNLIPGAARASESAEARQRPDGERRRAQTTIERFADDIGLSAEQRARIEDILDEYRSSARALQREVQPKYRSLMDSIRVRIESVLTSDQVTQYRSLLAERARREGWGRRDNDEPGSERGAREDADSGSGSDDPR